MEITKPKNPLLEPVNGKTKKAKSIKNRANTFIKRLWKKSERPKSNGINADRTMPNEFGSLKVELTLLSLIQYDVFPKLNE